MDKQKKKVPRYRAGKVPAYAKDAEAEDGKFFEQDAKPTVAVKSEPTDRRLLRAAKTVDKSDALERHRNSRNVSDVAEIISTEGMPNSIKALLC